MKYILFLLLFLIHFNYNFCQENNSAVIGNNEFSFELLKKLIDKKTEANLFFSPISISSALAMTYAGSRNETKIQISNTLHFSLNSELLCNDFHLLLNKIQQNNNSVNVSIANSLWAQKDYHFLEGYLNIVGSKFNSTLIPVDFTNSVSRENARYEINKWVGDKTNNKIKEIIQPDALDNNTRLVLINAIYFKAAWQKVFEKEKTGKAKFSRDYKNSIETDFMNETAQYNYYENDTLQILEMPYKQCNFSMLVLLPRKLDGMGILGNIMNIQKLNEYVNLLKFQNVEVSIPKFKTVSEFSLTQILSEMGMPVAFGNDADFSGMTGNKELKVSNVIHKAFIEVSEQGTEAAAATSVIMSLKSMRIANEKKIFKADHPFIYLIMDNTSKSIIFIGVLNNPKE
jgi:serpin B